MKAIKKNGYFIVTLTFFIISLSVLVLFITLFSQSTAVDNTTVGSVYIGDLSDEKAKRTKLITDVNTWKKSALYTISFQGVEIMLGRYEKLDENGNNILDAKGNITYLKKGLEFLEFDCDSTINHINSDYKDNLAYYTINAEKKQDFYDLLVENYGTRVCDTDVLEFDALVNNIVKSAQSMTTIVNFNLSDFLKEGFTNTTVTSIPLTNLDSNTVNLLSELFEGEKIELLPQDKTKNKLGFSAIEYFQANEKFADLTSAEMSIIATGLAAVVQKTSFTVTVKNQGYISDRYYAYDGMTARINIKDGTDLKIINPEDSSYYVTIEKSYDNELKFILTGCLFMFEYDVVKKATVIEYKVEYAAKESAFTYNELNPNMGIDNDKNCYYYIQEAGTDTILYAYTKVITYLDGSTSEVEVYPKQEYYEGNNEVRFWKNLPTT